MPILPSGRHLAITCQIVLKMAELNAQSVQRYPIHRVKTVADLYPLVEVLLFRPNPDYQPPADAYHPCSQNQEEMATQEPYRSGFTLATFDPEAHNWSQEDCDAYAAFLLEDRTQAHLQEALEQVLESQRLKPKAHIPPDLFGDLSGDELMDMFWEQSQRSAEAEPPLLPRPEDVEFDQFDLLAALCQMNCLRESEKWQTRFPDIWNRLEAFLDRLRTEDRLLSAWLQPWMVEVEEFAGRLRAGNPLARLSQETLDWLALQTPQEVFAILPVFAEPAIATAFAAERAILEAAAFSISPAGS